MALHDAPPDATLPAWFDELDDRPVIYATMGTVIPIAPLIGCLIDGLSPLPASLTRARVSRPRRRPARPLAGNV
jgi:hypothetical protein